MSRHRYAKGTRAWGICQRSGARYLLSDLIEDGRIPGLLVHPSWYEPFQQQERPIDVSDPQALRDPSPEVSIESNYKVPAPSPEAWGIPM
jgi:hypothetical protein